MWGPKPDKAHTEAVSTSRKASSIFLIHKEACPPLDKCNVYQNLNPRKLVIMGRVLNFLPKLTILISPTMVNSKPKNT